MKINYLLRAILAFPILPLLYFQGKRIRASIPRLPEAKGTEGQYFAEEKTDRTLHLLAIGESTIAGVGVQTHEEGFTGTLAAEISRLFHTNVEWKVYARSGYTARKVHQSIIPKIAENHAHLLIFGLGGNDAFTLNRPSRWKKEIRTLIKSAQARFPESIIVFCHMPPIKEFPAFTPLIKWVVGNLVEILGEELQEVVRDFRNVHYVKDKISLKDWMDKFQLGMKKADFFSDGIHPSRLTYQVWARDIAHEIYTHQASNRALVSMLHSEK